MDVQCILKIYKIDMPKRPDYYDYDLVEDCHNGDVEDKNDEHIERMFNW